MRQPFVGLILAAIIGIVVADFWPVVPGPILSIEIAAALIGLRWTFTTLVFALVGATFFAVHSARVSNTPVDVLAQIAGQRPHPASVVGSVTTEPKIESNGNATFLLKLHDAKIDGQDLRT